MLLLLLQLLLLDRVDVGLLNTNEIRGRKRLEQTVSDLSDAIRKGVTGKVDDARYGVITLRKCGSGDGINDGCSDGTVLATGPPDIGKSVATSWTSANSGTVVIVTMATASIHSPTSLL